MANNDRLLVQILLLGLLAAASLPLGLLCVGACGSCGVQAQQAQRAIDAGDARELALGQRATFSAWRVAARAPDQVLLQDFSGRTGTDNIG